MTIISGLGLLGCGMVVTIVFWVILSKAFEYEKSILSCIKNVIDEFEVDVIAVFSAICKA
jgi:hypothetical protein